MKRSKIGWTDYSGGDLNFVTGCTPVSAGCKNCYARRIYERFGRDFSKVTIHPDKLERLSWKKPPHDSLKRGAPHRPMAFVCDTGDLFHENVPRRVVIQALTIMRERKDVTWQILTKRPTRMKEIVTWYHNQLFVSFEEAAPNLWFGVSVEDQRSADERIPILMGTPAAMLFVSIEPMLESVDLRYECPGCPDCGMNQRHVPNGLAWVIVGAESGPNRRPFEVSWAADIKRQCDEAGIPFFGKQASDYRPGKPLLIEGREWKEWP